MVDARVRRRKSEKSNLVRSPKIRKNNAPVSSRYCASAFLLLVSFTVVLCSAFIALSPSKINAKYYEFPEPREFNGPLAENNMLTKAEHLFTGQIMGPESVLLHNGSIFTGTKDGRIFEFKNDRIIRVFNSSETSCDDYDNLHTCGRPLGIQSFDENTLIFVDAYLGLFILDLTTGNLRLLVKGGQIVQGKPLTFLNHLVVLKNGTVLFTDSSSKYQLRDFMFDILEHSGDGRLLSYDTKTKELRVVLDSLYFANGLELSRDEEYVLIAETTNARILKYYLKGPKIGMTDVFIDNLPGLPDNIRSSKNGSYWIGLVSVRKRGKLSAIDSLGPYPVFRNIIAKLIPAKYLTRLTQKVMPSYGIALLVDEKGRIVSSLHDPTGATVSTVTEIADDGKSLYLGCYYSPYLAKLKYAQ